MKQITKKRFRQWIYESRGEAIRWVQQHGDEGVESVIEEACVRCLNYDPQINGVLDWYMAEIIELSRSPRRYIDVLINHYWRIRNFRNQEQASSVLTELAKRGYVECEIFICSNWLKELRKDRIHLTHAYMELGKVRAYKQVLTAIARSRSKVLHDWNMVCQVRSYAEDAIGESKASQILNRMILKHQSLLRLFQLPYTPEPLLDDDSYRDLTVDQIHQIAQKRRGAEFRCWLRKAGEKELAMVAPLLELDLATIEATNWLWVFTRKPYPGPVENILRWIENEETQRWAIMALGQIRAPKGRETALEWLKDDFYQSFAIKVFESNFESGDESLLLDQLKQNIVSPWLHGSLMSIDELVKKIPKANWNPLMRFAFEYTPCASCRLDYAQYLNRHRLLTKDEINVLCFDGCEDTRRWARGLKKRRQRRRSTI